MAERRQIAGSGGLQVSIVTPRGPARGAAGAIMDVATDALTAPGELGEFEVLAGHVPFLTALHPGVLRLGENGPREVFAVGRGYVKVGASGQVEVLVDQAVAAASIDAETARAELQQAESALAQWKAPQNAEWQELAMRRDWARARVNAAELSR
jgi:F-type H+-transporting ATPase subunit epsilon